MAQEEKNDSLEKEEKKEESLSDLRKYVLSEISGKSEKVESRSDVKVENENDSSGEVNEKKSKNKGILSKMKPRAKKGGKKERIEFNSLKADRGKQRSLSKILIRSFLVLILALAVALAVFSFGIYKYNWNDRVSNFLLSVVPYPAAIVDKDIILYRDYKNVLGAVIHSSEKGGVRIEDENSEAYKEASEKVLGRMIDNRLIGKIAAENSIFLSEEEISGNLNAYIAQSGGEEAFSKVIKDLYLWDVNDFKERLLKPVLLEGKLNEYIILSEDFNKSNSESAKKILAELKSDLSEEKFIELVKTYSDDFASVESGGDLGWFEKGVMVPEFEEAAFSLGTGEVSEVVRTIYGFHIIMVNEINNEEGKIKARHILIRARNLYDVLEERKEGVKIFNFVD